VNQQIYTRKSEHSKSSVMRLQNLVVIY